MSRGLSRPGGYSQFGPTMRSEGGGAGGTHTSGGDNIDGQAGGSGGGGAGYPDGTGNGPGAENGCVAGAFIKSRKDMEMPDLQFHFIPLILSDHGRERFTEPGLSIHVCQLRPESRGEVKLASKNPLDYPSINAYYLSARSDLDTLVEGVKLARKIFQAKVFSAFLGEEFEASRGAVGDDCLLYTSPSPRDRTRSRMPSSA